MSLIDESLYRAVCLFINLFSKVLKLGMEIEKHQSKGRCKVSTESV